MLPRRPEPAPIFRKWNYSACAFFVASIAFAFIGWIGTGAACMLGTIVAYGVAVYRVRCVKCGKHLLLAPGPAAMVIPSAFPSKCPRCDTSTRSGESNAA